MTEKIGRYIVEKMLEMNPEEWENFLQLFSLKGTVWLNNMAQKMKEEENYKLRITRE